MAAQNSEINSKKKAPGRPFQKGQSGNPGGRPRMSAELKEKLKGASEKAVQFLIETLENDEARPDLRMDCAKTILDRTYGKAAQQIDADISDTKIEIVMTDAARELMG